MSSRAKRLSTAFGGVIAASAVLLCASPGASAAVPARAVPDWVISLPLAQTPADVQKVIDYWKPERLRQASSYAPSRKAPATPVPRTTTTATKAVSDVVADVGSTTAASIEPTRGVATMKTALPITVGKVFFKVGDKEYWCSASAVHSANRNLVATAGHCAYDFRQARAVEDWIFIPGYTSDGRTDLGIYVGHTLNLHQSFASLGDFDYDYAFVTVNRGFEWQVDKDATGQPKKDVKGNVLYKAVDKGRLEDMVGGQGFLWNQKLKTAAYAFGYPAGEQPDGSTPYDGSSLKWCYSKSLMKVTAPNWLLSRGVSLKCTFTSGASGGPWLSRYDSSTRSGYLMGVNSLTWDRDADRRFDHVSSPYFNTSTYVIYKHATTESTG
jgi:hypothetical protein